MRNTTTSVLATAKPARINSPASSIPAFFMQSLIKRCLFTPKTRAVAVLSAALIMSATAGMSYAPIALAQLPASPATCEESIDADDTRVIDADFNQVNTITIIASKKTPSSTVTDVKITGCSTGTGTFHSDDIRTGTKSPVAIINNLNHVSGTRIVNAIRFQFADDVSGFKIDGVTEEHNDDITPTEKTIYVVEFIHDGKTYSFAMPVDPATFTIGGFTVYQAAVPKTSGGDYEIDAASNQQQAAVGSDFSLPIRYRITAADGRGVPNQAIEFTSTGSASTAAAYLRKPGAAKTTEVAPGTLLEVKTDVQGYATVIARANAIGGEYAIDFAGPGVEDHPLTLSNVATTLALIDGDKQKTKVNPEKAAAALVAFAPLRVIVHNIVTGGDNTLRENAEVTFTLSDDSMATLSANAADTNADGIAEIIVTPKNKAGEYTITAATIGTADAAEAVVFNLSNEAVSGFCFPVMGDNGTAVVCL